MSYIIYSLRGYDPDGDSLEFGVTGEGSDLVTVVPRDQYTAELYLTRVLDHELAAEHVLLVTLTDGHLGQDNFITQPLLILVEDSNDNSPVFVNLPGTNKLDMNENELVRLNNANVALVIKKLKCNV